MKINPVPDQDFLRECFDYNPDTGTLSWRARPRAHFSTESKWKRHRACDVGRSAGTSNLHGYLVVRLTREGVARIYPVHRLIWALVHGGVALVVDHINGVRSDNRLQNLQEISQSENVRKKAHVRAGLRGAHYEKARDKWRSQIRIGGRQILLGRFESEREAHEAYQSALQNLKKDPL